METYKKDKISIVVPCYNEESSLQILCDNIRILEKKLDDVCFEIIFVDDGSTDKTQSIIKKISLNDNQIKYISFSRNFGKEAALYAGLEKTTGDYVAVMDADMQDPPELILKMYKILKEESDQYDCARCRRISRTGEPFIRSICAKLFYYIMNKISGLDIMDGARDFCLMSRKMCNAILSLHEYNRFSKGIFSWVGFKCKWLDYDNVERINGETKWSFFQLVAYAIQGVLAFSTLPLIVSSILGFMFCFLACVMICFIIGKTLLYGDAVSGWPSMACFILFLSGIQLFSIGILGQYMSKLYLETKNRPVYIIRETNCIDKNK